jgi:uncharacterized protein (DUF2225 family)
MTTLRIIALRCPVCSNHFMSQAVESTDPLAGERTDFQACRPGVQHLPFLIHLCERCGYAGTEDQFSADTQVSPGVVARVWNELAPRLDGAGLTGSEKYEFAAKVAMWQGDGPKRLGELWLRAAWCCIDEDDTEAERYFRRHAAWAFERALRSYDEVDRDERAVATYLVGELWRRIGDERRAKQWFDKVPNEITEPATQRWLLDAARQQKADPQEWFRHT